MHGTNHRLKPYLTHDEEMELSTHLLQASVGLGKTPCDVKCSVGSYTKSKGILKGSVMVSGRNFWNKTQCLAFTQEIQQLDTSGCYDNHAEAIYNMDETEVLLEFGG